MGSEDMERQRLNVYRMRMLGAKVRKVESGSKTLKDSINEALRDWVSNIDDTYYLIGSVVGPHPYPTMVRDFQCVIGREARRQVLTVEGRLPRAIVACVGGGSNAIGIFHPFLHGIKLLSESEGIIPALEPSHAISYASKLVKRYGSKDSVIINLSGRGDKDVETVAKALDY